jgi:hypothetical protein
VHLAAFARPDVGVDGFAHDRVGELKALPRPQNRECDQHVSGAGHLLVGEFG